MHADLDGNRYGYVAAGGQRSQLAVKHMSTQRYGVGHPAVEAVCLTMYGVRSAVASILR